MAKDEFVMLAHKFDKKKHHIAGWFVSEKLDGMRAIWIPETRGLSIKDVKFANREKDFRNHICTGLWSRLRKPIFAPNWWLDLLPKDIWLDGELWIDRGRFQDIMSICKTLIPGSEWNDVKFMVFDVPNKFPQFDFSLSFLKSLEENSVLTLVKQEQLPFATITAKEKLEFMLDSITSTGGEGLMLRKPSSVWVPERSYSLLKVKSYEEGVGKVIGYTFGRKTDKGSRLLGKMGALILSFNGKRLEISGFTDEEREFCDYKAEEIAEDMPGEDAPPWVKHPKFPLGSIVRFRYRELTDDGVPKEARYFR